MLLSTGLSILLSAVSVFAATDRTYPGVQSYLKDLAAKYPENAQVIDLGRSDSGEIIQGLKVGKGATPSLVVGTHHGNEYGSTEVALAFADEIAKKPISDQTLYVIPVLNISGYNVRNRYERSEDGMYHDPNRNYPGPCDTSGPFTLKSTQILADFVRDQGIVNSATLHTYYPAVVYPWGHSTQDTQTEYDDLFIEFVKTATHWSGYDYGNSTQLIYAADGTYEDYAFWQHGIWSILFELGYSHSPTQEQIDSMIATNVPGMRAMFEGMPSERAEKHDFTGKCETWMKRFDRHDE